MKRSPALVVAFFFFACAAFGQQVAPSFSNFLPSGPAPHPAFHPLAAGAFGPEPLAAGDQRPNEPYPANIYLAPWSRMSVGGDVSLLGIGVKSAIDMNTDMDLRGDLNFFRFNPGKFEIDGFDTYMHVQFTSAAAMYDVYPWNSVWRLSAGVMLFNNNQFSGTVDIVPGTQFTLNGQNFYSANPKINPATTPLTGGGALGFHRHSPALIVSTGFGKFIPRSYRHWSFPSEFGVVFTGGPTINVNETGWVCKDPKETECANLSDPSNPVTIQFNDALNGQLAKWRRSFNAVPVYPIFTYSVVYSFNIR